MSLGEEYWEALSTTGIYTLINLTQNSFVLKLFLLKAFPL